MKVFVCICAALLLACSLVACGNGDSVANDINGLFDDFMPDGMEMTTDDFYGYDGIGNGNPYGMYGNYGGNSSEYEYNNNYNNVYGTAPGDFNRAGYNNSGIGNMDFDITPSDFASEKDTQS